MAAIHVFAIDWVPAATDVASGGGLRSRQIIDALCEAGHSVSFSVPSDCRHLRRVGPEHPSVQNVNVHNENNQLDVLRKFRPQVVVWLSPLIRSIPFTGSGEVIHVCDLIGLAHVEASLSTPALEPYIRQRLVRLCRLSNLVLTGSEEQNGYWLAELSRGQSPPPAVVIPYSLPDGLRTSNGTGSSALARLHVASVVQAWSTSTPLLERVADWIAGRHDVTLSLIVDADSDGATDRSTLQKLLAISRRPRVEMPGAVSFAEAMADYRPGSVALDIHEPNMARRMAVPIRTVNALTHGVPVVSTIDGTLMRRLQSEGAGVIATDGQHQPIEQVLDRIATLPPAVMARMSKAARGFAQREYAASSASASLAAAIEQAIHVEGTRNRAGPAGYGLGGRGIRQIRPLHVLVISDREPRHRERRVDVPFNALFGHQKISGYSVWSRGNFTFTTSSQIADQAFDALWVQREISPEVAIALNTLGRPFAYDLDDDLLASPHYRQSYPIALRQTVRNLILSCSVLSCSTARLGQLLNSKLPQIVEKVVVTPNLLHEPPPARQLGPPRFLIWAASDPLTPTQSYLAVVKAIRDFCLTHNLRVVCIGEEPPKLIIESDVEIVHVQKVPHGSYLSLLRSFSPGIMAGPKDDDDTSDFTQAKSDINILEALACGLVGVFSWAYAYSAGDLPQPILCENTYGGWKEALDQARLLCGRSDEQGAIPPTRFTGSIGVQPWLDAINLVRLPTPMTHGQFVDAVSLLRCRYESRPLTEAEFDAGFYLEKNPDIIIAIKRGTLGGPYEHYRAFGFHEGRPGRPNEVSESHNQQVWANLIHTLGDLRTAVGVQGDRLEALKTQRKSRMRLR
jgi:hypothetical protein